MFLPYSEIICLKSLGQEQSRNFRNSRFYLGNSEADLGIPQVYSVISSGNPGNFRVYLLLADYGQSCEVAAWDDPVISEIHYNPSTQQGSDSDFEFVELMNPHPFAIDVGGWSLGDGIDDIAVDLDAMGEHAFEQRSILACGGDNRAGA